MPSEQTTLTKHNWSKLLLLLELPKHIIQTLGANEDDKVKLVNDFSSFFL